jgi:hypothetical protein
MLLILWSTCWLVSSASLVVDLIRPRSRQDPRQTRYLRLTQISLMVVATGGILNYFLNDHQAPGSYALRMAADTIQLAGYFGAISSSLRRLTIARKGMKLQNGRPSEQA